ncbi:MAG: HNH endonuclease [Betaproteobacteria bacterium]
MLYVVTGPPAGGKSTWVRENAKLGDITIDYDALANTLTPQSKGSHEHTAHVKKVTKAARQAAIDTALGLSAQVDVYIIHSTPSAQLLTKYRNLGAEIIVCDPGRDVVLARAKAERPWWLQGAIKRWYEEHPEMSSQARGGHRWRQLAARFKAQCAKRNDVCVHCEQPIDYEAAPQTAGSFEADHYRPIATHPELALMIGNLRPSHSSCNRSRGAKPMPESSDAWVAADW